MAAGFGEIGGGGVMGRVWIKGFEVEGPPQNDNQGMSICLLHLTNGKSVAAVATPRLVDCVLEAFRVGGLADWSFAQTLTGAFMEVDRVSSKK